MELRSCDDLCCMYLQSPDGRLVFLKTRGDMLVYRGLLLVAGLGTAYVLSCLSLFAAGKLKKRERS